MHFPCSLEVGDCTPTSNSQLSKGQLAALTPCYSSPGLCQFRVNESHVQKTTVKNTLRISPHIQVFLSGRSVQNSFPTHEFLYTSSLPYFK